MAPQQQACTDLNGRRWYQCERIPEESFAQDQDLARTWGIDRASGLSVREDFGSRL